MMRYNEDLLSPRSHEWGTRPQRLVDIVEETGGVFIVRVEFMSLLERLFRGFRRVT